MVTLKALFSFMGTISGEHFVSFDPLISIQFSGLSYLYSQNSFINDIFLLLNSHLLLQQDGTQFFVPGLNGFTAFLENAQATVQGGQNQGQTQGQG